MASLLAPSLLATFLAAAPASALPPEGALPKIAAADASKPAQEAAAPGESRTGEAAEAGCLDRTVDALQARYEGVRSVRARFVQTVRAAHTGGVAPEPVVSAGRMVVEKPARMRWSYEEPEESLVVSDGESLWMYDPAFGEAQRLPVGEGFLSGAAVSFLLGEGDLRRDFEISLVSCEEGSAELELVPREPATYERLHVVADPRDGTLSHTRVSDLLGNVTDVALSEIETNVATEPGTFRFEAPEGVSVIELDPVDPGGGRR